MNDDLFSCLHVPESTPSTPSNEVSPQARIASLRQEILRHNELYYAQATPEISDKAYDRLLAELITLERQYPELLTADSPSQRVGGRPLEAFQPYEHIIPMQSIDNTYEADDVVQFDAFIRNNLGRQVVEYVVEPKIDGIAFAAHYEEGLLVAAATRGNGLVGDEVTANARTIASLPLSIPLSAACFEVRGEIYMPKSAFLALTESQINQGEVPFKNPRNAAAGSMKLLDSRQVASRHLEVLLYGIGRVDGMPEPASHAELLQQLASLGFPTQPKTWRCQGIQELLKAIEELKALRHQFPFEMDGAVIKVNDRSVYRQLGSTARAPRWARAFKYPPEQAETVVEAITIQVGRTGVLTPVAELRTVHVCGSDIARATLHNAEDIQRKDLRIGDHVLVEKAGEVIPAITTVLTEKRSGLEIPFQMPTTCPECGSPVSQQPGEVAVRCTNLLCPAQRTARLLHFASRDALDIEGLGERIAQALIDQNLVSQPLDLFQLNEPLLATLKLEPVASSAASEKDSPASASVPTQFSLFPDFSPVASETKYRLLGPQNAKTILQAIERSRSLSLARWIYALGIPTIGKTIAEDLAKLHADFEAFTNSDVLRDTLQLYQWMEEADANNPNSQRVRALDIESRVACAERFEALNQSIESLGASMVQAKTATRIKGAYAKFSCLIKLSTAHALNQFFQSPSGIETIQRLRSLQINPSHELRSRRAPKTAQSPTASIDTPHPTSTQPDSFFANKIVVITGSFHDKLSRNSLRQAILAAGGKVNDSLSSNTDYLIVGKNPGHDKTSRAQELNTPTLDEATTREYLGLPPFLEQSTLL